MKSAVDAQLDQLVRRIVDRVRPRRIVLFGSRARGDAKPWSDFDLMIEVDAVPPWNETAEIREHANRGLPASLDLHFFTPAEVEAQRDDGGRVVFDVVREGKVLFIDRAIAADPPLPRLVREPEAPWGSARDTARSAERDRLLVRNNIVSEQVPWEMVAFHAQQAAEKYLKAFLLARRIRPERTHNLTRLLDACRAAGATLPGLDSACTLLTPYAVRGRYGPPLDDRATGLAAVAAADRIADAVRSLLPTALQRDP